MTITCSRKFFSKIIFYFYSSYGIYYKLSGKLGGARGRTEKFSAGYLKYAGFPAENIVKKAFTLAQLKLGTVGITVRILTEMPAEKQIKQIKVDDNKNEIKHEILEEGKEDVTDKEERVKENGESRTDEETK